MVDPEIIAAKLLTAIAGGNPRKIKSCIVSAQNALAHCDPSAQGTLGILISQAQAAAATAAVPDKAPETQPSGRPEYPPFDKAVSKYFSNEEREYYEGFNPQHHYSVQMHHRNGGLLKNPDGTPAEKQVSGEEIRNAIATAKYHTLTDGQRQELRQNLPKETEKRERLEELKNSLDVLEGRRAVELREQGVAEQGITAMSEKFNAARSQIDAVVKAMNAIGANREKSAEAPASDSMEKAMMDALPIKLQTDLRKAQHDLRNTLQNDIFEGAMGLRKPEKQSGRFESADVRQEPAFNPVALHPDSASSQAMAL